MLQVLQVVSCGWLLWRQTASAAQQIGRSHSDAHLSRWSWADADAALFAGEIFNGCF